jgi:hypothetical protein
MLQISTSGGLRGLGTAFDDALTLQMAANRYAASVGKARIGEDHVIGPLTVALVRAALQFLVSRGQSEAATMLNAQAVNVSTLKAAAANVADYLNTSMDAIKLSGGAPATSSTSSSWTDWFGITPSTPMPTTPMPAHLPGGYVAPPGGVPKPMPGVTYYTPAQMAQQAARQTTLKYALIGGGALVALIALVMLMPKKPKAVAA